MKKEVKVDWSKVNLITKFFAILSAISLLFIITSLIIGIWCESFPAYKCFLTGILMFLIGGWVVRTNCLDENGDVKEKLIKNY